MHNFISQIKKLQKNILGGISMRRFYAFLIMAFSLIAIVVFNIQGQYYSFRSGLEYSTGTEVTYKITPNEGENDFSLQEVADIFTSRLEASGAKDYYVYAEEETESTLGGAEPYYQIVVRLAGMEGSLTDILRSVETYGNIWITTQDNDRTEDGNDIVRGTATVDYSGSAAYVEVEVTNAFQEDVGSKLDAYVAAGEEGEDGETTEESGDRLILWTNYEDNVDSYEEAIKDITLEQKKMQEKILCVLESGAFTKGTDGNPSKIKIENIGYVSEGVSTTTLYADSAHSIERLLNSPEVNFSITRLHLDTISAQYGNDALLKVSIAMVVAFVVTAIALVAVYGIGGAVGSISLMLSLFLITALYNFFGLAIGPSYLVSYVVALGLGVVIITSYLGRLKNELYKGRTPSKANKEGFKKAVSTSVDATVFTLLTSILLAILSRNSLINFSLYLIFGAIINVFVCLFITRLLLYWFSNSKMAQHKALYRVKVSRIPDVNKEESQTYFGAHENYDPNKHKKASALGIGILSLVSLVSIITFSVVSTTFRYTNEFDSYTKVQIVDRNGEDHFATEEAVYDFYENFDLEPNDVTISIVTDPNDPDQKDEVYYVNATFKTIIEEESDVRDQIVSYLSSEFDLDLVASGNEDETYDSINFLTVTPQVYADNFNNALLLILVTSVCAVIYIVIRYRYTFTVPSLVLILATVLITSGIVSLSRVPVSSNLGIALLAGVLLTTLLEFIPLVRYGQLVKESKNRNLTYEDRKVIALTSLRRSMTSIFVTYGISMLSSLVLLLLSPLEMYSLYLITMLCITVGLLTLITIYIPLYLFSERHLRLTFLSKLSSSRKVKKANKTKEQKDKRIQTEPMEVIYPGIND